MKQIALELENILYLQANNYKQSRCFIKTDIHLNPNNNNNNNNNNNRRPLRRQEEEPYKINERIKEPEVRLVGDNVEVGIYPTKKALAMAKEQGLDLVEISDKATPPVCKIIDYSKFKYEQKKKQKEIKAKAQKTVIKEIRFGPNTDDHDFEFKLKHAENFLKEGNKVKAFVQFVGRTIVFKERGELLLLKFAQGLEEHGKVEQLPKLEGKRMSIFIAPKNTKSGK
jgi:translation initiation factor IF-3